MTAELWTPSEVDHVQADEAYIHYAAGLAIINDPEILYPIHRHEFVPENYNAIIVEAEMLILDGLKEFIRYAQPPDRRTRLSDARHEFNNALPHMREALDHTYTSDDTLSRLRELNPFFPILRPAAFCDKVIYHRICQGNVYKISTKRTLHNFSPHDNLRPLIEGRTLAEARQEAYTRIHSKEAS